MPIIFAQTIIIVPGTIASFLKNPALLATSRRSSPRARCRTTSSFAVLILLFSYFYTSIIFNPVDLSENLKKQGGFIPGVKPGAATADYIDAVLARDHAARARSSWPSIAILPIVVSPEARHPVRSSAAPRC